MAGNMAGHLGIYEQKQKTLIWIIAKMWIGFRYI